MPTTQISPSAKRRTGSSWLSFLRVTVCEHCGAKQARRPFRRPYAWCWKCEALLDPELVLLGKAGTLVLDGRRLAKHPEPITKLIGLVVLTAVADGAEELDFEPTAEELRIWCRVDQDKYEMVPPPYELHEAIVQVLKAISNVDPHQSGPVAGRLDILLHDDGNVIQCATTEFAPTPFGERMTIHFPAAGSLRREFKEQLTATVDALAKREDFLGEFDEPTI
jgi:hypothetical protein